MEKENKLLWDMIKTMMRLYSELEEKNEFLIVENKSLRELSAQQDQFLKVVESVIKEHGIIWTSAKYITCNCLLKFDDSSFYKEHIYQEIKSVIEKVKE